MRTVEDACPYNGRTKFRRKTNKKRWHPERSKAEALRNRRIYARFSVILSVVEGYTYSLRIFFDWLHGVPENPWIFGVLRTTSGADFFISPIDK